METVMTKEQLDVSALVVVNNIADLNLTEDRIALFKETYAQWIDAANELNRKMSEEEHRTLTPITVLQHNEKVYD